MVRRFRALRSLLSQPIIMLLVLSVLFPILQTLKPVEGTTAQPSFQRYPANPVLDVGAGDAWDNFSVSLPYVMKQDSLYKMWYLGCNNKLPFNPECSFRIGYATSTNGQTWTKYSSNPVLKEGTPGSWDSADVGGSGEGRPSVYFNGSGYMMWYTGDTGLQESRKIGLAFSADGANWIKYSGNPVISSAPWAIAAASPWVIRINGTFWMYFIGFIPQWNIGFAKSSDGIHWNVNPTPILSPGPASWDSYQLFNPTVVRNGSNWMMAYTGEECCNANWAIGLASSNDASTWTKLSGVNPVFVAAGNGAWDGGGVAAGSLLTDNDGLRLYYSGWPQQIGDHPEAGKMSIGLTTSQTGSPSVSTPVASRSSVDAGQNATFSVSASGGSGGYTYTWLGLPPGCSIANTASLTCTPSGSGTFSIYVNVTDSGGRSATSSSLSFTVYPDPLASTPVASPSSADVGQAVSFSLGISGGSGGNSYVWYGLPTGCSSSNSNPIYCNPAGSGTFHVYVGVTDSNGYSVYSGTLSFTVYSDPYISTPTANPPSGGTDIGQGVTFSTSASSGSGGYSYAWLGLPTGCPTKNMDTLSCTPTEAGTFAIIVRVMDSNGYPVTSGTLSYTVLTDPSVSGPSASPVSVDLGQSVAFSASVTEGSGGFAYIWSGLPEGCSSTNAPSFSCTPSASGPSTITVRVTDSNSFSATSNGLSFTVYTDPSVGIPIPSPSSVDVGQTLSFSASPSGGSGGYTYVWNGLPTGCSSSNTAMLYCTPTGPGLFSITVRVTDSNGYTITSRARSYTVYTDPSLSTPTAFPGSVIVGHSVDFSVTVYGGSGGNSYIWNGLPTGCSSINMNPLNCTPTIPGTFNVMATVSDSNGYSVTGGILSFKVSLPPPPVTVFITLLPSSGSSSLSTANSFTITYFISGTLHTGTNNGTNPTKISADPSTLVTISATSSASSGMEKWCLSQACETISFDSGNGTNVTYYYYDLIVQSVSAAIAGGGTPIIAVSYLTAPASPSSTDSPQPATLTLSDADQTIWIVRGSIASVLSSVAGAVGERWIITTPSWHVSAPNQIPNPITSYHQYQVSIIISPLGTGSTTPSGSIWINATSIITIVATPNSGYEFTGWTSTGAVSVTSPNSSLTTVKVSGPGTLMADFASIPQFPWVYLSLATVALIAIIGALLYLQRRGESRIRRLRETG